MEDDFIIELTEAEAELTGETIDTSFNLVSYACRSGTFDNLKARDISHNIATILRTIPRNDIVLTDETARFLLLYAFLTNAVGVKEVHKIDSPIIRSVLYEILNQQLPGSKLSAQTLLGILPRIVLPSPNNDLALLAYLADAAELLLTSAPADYRNMYRTNNPYQARQWASVNVQAGSSKAFSNMEIYRLLSIWYCRVRLNGKMYSLFVDRTSLEQLRQCVRFFAGLQFYCWNYRVTGRTDRSYDRRTTFNVLLKWIIDAIWYCYENKIVMGSIAKHCKVSIGAITTLLFDDKDIPQFGATERYQALYQEAAEVLPGYEHLIDILTEKCLLYEDEYLDFAYVFHGLPTVDFSPKHLLEKTARNMNSPANHMYSADALEDFMKYAKAFHVSHIAYVTKGKVNVHCVNGYNHSDKNWFQKCSGGSYMMPPKDEWGKCWVEDHYEYKELIEYWYLDASDTTHVNRDIKSELRIQARTYIERLEANELTYLFLYGDKLSRNIEPSKVRTWMGTSRLPQYCLSMLSAKAENTKYGDKMRDIHAADDISRECMTEVDRNTNRIASDIAGPVLRMPAPVLNRLLMNTASKLLSGGTHFATSQDVSQWSVNMPRTLMFQFSEYLIGMCRGQDKLHLRDIWKNLTLAINRRGFASSKRVDDGCVMGWTGCNDTILHATLVSYCVYKAKEAGIIYPDESGESFELIDDSVLAMKLSEKVKYATDRISKFLDIMIQTYQSLGFEIDKTKTIVSSCKMTFLNRVFSRGAEVLTPAKVAAKVDREITRRFSSILEQVQSIFTSGSSAIGRGADPIVYYIYCVHKALTYFSRVIQMEKFSPSDLAFVARAPQAIGGWGIPGMIAMLTTGRSDNLSTFIYEEFETIKILTTSDPSIAAYYNARLRSVLERGFLKPTALTFIQNPTGICLTGPTNPAQRAKREFRRAAFRAARSPFVRTLLSEANEESLERAIDCLLRSGVHDAAFLEAINDALPSGIFQSIVDRASKHEVISLLIKGSVRSKIQKNIRSDDRKFVAWLPDFITTIGNIEEHPILPNASGYTRDLREQFYSFIGYKIVNHTTPVPTEILNHCHKIDNATTITARRLKKIQRERSGDFYWGTSDILQTDLHVTPSVRDQVVLRGYIPGVRSLIRACTLNASYRDEKMSLTKYWSQLLSMCWTGTVNEFDSIQPPETVISNTKSILRNSRRVNASVVGFPNTLGVIEINNNAIHSYLARRSTRHHSILIVQELRCAAILDYAAGNMSEGEIRYYTIDPCSLILNDNIIARGAILPGFHDLLLQIIPMGKTLPRLSAAIEEAINSLPRIEEGEIFEPKHVAMVMDVEGIVATHLDFPPRERHLSKPTSGPLHTPSSRPSSVVKADVAPHVMPERHIQPSVRVELLKYETDAVTSVLTVMRDVTMQTFQYAVVKQRSYTTDLEVLLSTGIHDIDTTVRVAWASAYNVYRSHPESSEGVLEWVKYNIDYPKDNGVRDLLLHPNETTLNPRLAWCARMILSYSLVAPFRSDEIEIAKRDTYALWRRWEQNAHRRVNREGGELRKWQYVLYMLHDVYWNDVNWVSFSSFSRCVCNIIVRFFKMHANTSITIQWTHDATLPEMTESILDSQCHVDQENRPVLRLRGFKYPIMAWNAIEEILYMFLSIRNYVAMHHTPASYPSLSEETVGIPIEDLFIRDPRPPRHISNSFNDKTVYYCYRAAKKMPAIDCSNATATNALQEILKEHGCTREQLWDRYNLKEFVELCYVSDNDDEEPSVDVRPR